jgi:hypothetical protein
MMKYTIRNLVGWFVFGFTVTMANGSIAGAAGPVSATDISQLRINAQLTAPWTVNTIYLQDGSQVANKEDLKDDHPLCMIQLLDEADPKLRALYPSRKITIATEQSKPNADGLLEFHFSGETKVLGMVCASGRAESRTPSLDEVKVALGKLVTASTTKLTAERVVATRAERFLAVLNATPSGAEAAQAATRKQRLAASDSIAASAEQGSSATLARVTKK